MLVNEINYYGRDGSVYPWDVRHNPNDPVFCEKHPDGSVTMQVHTEPGFAEVNLIYNDGTSKAVPLTLWGETARFQFWKCVFSPNTGKVHYGFALKKTDGTVVYIGPSGAISLLVYTFQLDLDAKKVFMAPGWMTGAFVYQIFPERFANGNPDLNPPGTVSWGTPPQSHQFQGGDLIGILEKLDYLQELGVDLLYLTPVFSSLSNHKYDTLDYYQVDPAFGGNQALRKLVNELHQRGMHIILDASFNHCHPGFFAFQDILKTGSDSKYWDWFTIYDYPVKIRIREKKLPKRVNEAREHWLTWFRDFEQLFNISVEYLDDDIGPGIEPSYKAWMNVVTMPEINLLNPEARAYFLNVAAYWIREFDIDGWRMDVVPWVVDDFWVEFRNTVKLAKPNAYLLSEVWGDVSHWLMGDRFDATMNYTFRQLVLDYFGTASMDTKNFLDGCQYMLSMYPSIVNGLNHNLISSHDTPRFLHLASEELPRLRLAQFFQFTMPGAPGIYYGEEIGITGAHDPDCRRTFPWDKKERWDYQTLEQVKSLANLRKEIPALRYGDWKAIWSGKEALAYIREYDFQRVLIVIARKNDLENESIPVTHSSPSLLWGVLNWEPKIDGILIKKLFAWSGVIIQL